MPREGLGTFPIRFSHPDDPGDAGWHLDGGWVPDGETCARVSLRSRGRALLMLFLFSDVGLLELDRPDGAYSPVERAVRLGLNR